MAVFGNQVKDKICIGEQGKKKGMGQRSDEQKLEASFPFD